MHNTNNACCPYRSLFRYGDYKVIFVDYRKNKIWQ